MKAHHLAAAATLVVAALLTVPGPAPLLATATAASCPDVEVVFARGTGEPPGVGRVGDAFVAALRSKVPGKSIGAYAVDYPANYNFLQATYGASDVSGHLRYMAGACPDTQLVLGGYSQGAAVIDIVTATPVGGFSVAQPLPPAAADRVAAVALFGNPSKRLGNVVTIASPQYAAKTIDLCSGNDPVCSDGRSWSAHTTYVQTGMTSQAAAFVAQRL